MVIEYTHTAIFLDGSKSHKEQTTTLEDAMKWVGPNAKLVCCADGPHYCRREGELRDSSFKFEHVFIIYDPAAPKTYNTRAVLAPVFAQEHCIYWGKVVIIPYARNPVVINDDHTLRGIIPMYHTDDVALKRMVTEGCIDFIW